MRAPTTLTALAVAALLVAGCAEEVEPIDPSQPGDEATAEPAPAPTEPDDPGDEELGDATADEDDHPDKVVSPWSGAEGVGDRGAVAVKIEDSPNARPQDGLLDADVVFEHAAEGSSTRLTAVFHSQLPDRVGNVRSVRRVDAQLLPAFDAPLVTSGGRPEVRDKLAGAGVDVVGEGSAGVYRSSDRAAPHNVYADLSAVEVGSPPGEVDGWTFADHTDGGSPVAHVEVQVTRGRVSRWDVRNDGRFVRQVTGGTHQTRQGPMVADNIVVVGTDVVEDGCCDTAGNSYTRTATTGSGPLAVFRDGERHVGQWRRDRTDSQFEWVDDTGDPLPLRPGLVWVLFTSPHHVDALSE